jgi:dephospho-CoA kinase
MLVVGLTGSIGSGKSTVAHLFAKHGVPVIDADLIAREITMPHTPAWQEIVNRFGNDILNTDASIDRGSLREIIFHQPEERLWLEALLHPGILQRMQENITQLQTAYCIAVIPLLLETDAATFVQRILVVDLPESTQIVRAKTRDQATPEQIKAILATQVSREQRLSRADDIIDNAGTPDLLEKQVENLHEIYLKLAQI